MDPIAILIIIVVLVLICVGAYFGHLAEKKRRELLTAFASQKGWSFEPARDHAFDKSWAGFGCFKQGHSRFAHNRMRGEVELPVGGERRRLPILAGDYHYQVTSGSGKNRSTRTYRFSYLLLETPTPGGDLAVRTEHWGDKLAAGLGFDDIDFESAEFSDRFHVKAADKRYAYDVLHPRMMEFLMNSMTPDFEVRRGWLCIHGGRSRWDPPEYDLRLRWLAGFFENWPRHLLQNTARTDGSQDA